MAFFHFSAAISVGSAGGENNYGPSLHNRGNIFFRQGKKQEAMSDWNQAIRAENYSKKYKENLITWIINHLDSINNKDELYEFLNQLPNRDPELNNKLAYVSYQLGKFEEANAHYNFALRVQPSLSVNVQARETSRKFVEEKREKEQQEREERNRQDEIRKQEAEVRRITDLKKAQVGDKLLYSETWGYTDGVWLFQTHGAYTMMVTCFIERIEGDRYQLRVGDVSSSDRNRSTTPVINGVRVNKGDLIWARPLNGNQWVYGESF